MHVDQTDTQRLVSQLIRNTPMQLLEIRQHIAPTHQRGAEDGSSHAKPSSRPPLAVDPIDALIAEEAQVLYWSRVYGFGGRGTVGQRIEWLAGRDIPAWDCDNILERWQPLRVQHEKRWPTADPKVWLSEFQAAQESGRTVRTLRDWRTRSPRIARYDVDGWMYDRNALVRMDTEMRRRVSERMSLANPLVRQKMAAA